MSRVILDDHLLRDFLADEIGPDLAGTLGDASPVTTNMYLARLCRSVVKASSGALTGSLSPADHLELGRRLLWLGDDVEVVPMRLLTYRMAVLADTHGLSTLGAEAVAAAEHLAVPLCVWCGDDGPRIRTAMEGIGGNYRTLHTSASA